MIEDNTKTYDGLTGDEAAAIASERGVEVIGFTDEEDANGCSVYSVTIRRAAPVDAWIVWEIAKNGQIRISSIHEGRKAMEEAQFNAIQAPWRHKQHIIYDGPELSR